MASYYAVAAGGNWNTAATWAATSGGAGGAGVPTSADDVFIDANSGPVTVNTAGQVCRHLNFTGSTATFTLNNNTLTIYGSLTMVSTMGYTVAGSSNNMTFAATTAQTITSAGKSLGALNFNGVGGSWTLQDATTAGGVTLTAGTLNTGGLNHTWTSFTSSNATARTLTLGASTITITGGNTSVWNTATATNFTFNVGTSTITFTGNNAGLQGGNLTYNNVVFSGTGTPSISASNTYANLTRTGTAAKTDGLQFNNSGQVITGTLTLSGNSVTNRLFANSLNLGSSVTVTVNGTVSLTNVDFADITAAGTAGAWAGTSLGNAGGNSNITFAAARSLYGVGSGTQNWDSTTTWATASGGAAGANPPLPQDDVTFDANSLATTYSINGMPRSGRNLTASAYTGTLSIATVNTTWFGNIIFGSGVTMVGSSGFSLAGRGAQTITSNGMVWSTGPTIASFGGSYQLQDDLNLANGAKGLNLQAGTTDLNGKHLTGASLQTTGSGTRALTGGAATIDLWGTGGGNPLSLSNITINMASTTINMRGVGANVIQFGVPDGSVWGTLNVTSPGPGVVQMVNTLSCSTLSISPGRAVQVTTGKTITVATASGASIAGQNWNAAGYQYLGGVSGNYISAPNAAPLQVTGSITLDAHVKPTSWAPGGATNQVLLAKWQASGQFSYLWYLTPTGGMILNISPNGSVSGDVATSNVAVPFAAGQDGWVRVSWVAGGAATFYTSTDGVTWTQLGNPQALNGAPASIFNSTSPLELGSSGGGTGNLLTGNFYRGRIYNSALGAGAGTPVFDGDLSTKVFGQSTFTESSTNAATVTVTGAQVGDGRVQIQSSATGSPWALGIGDAGALTADYMMVQDSYLTHGAPIYTGSHFTNLGNLVGWLPGPAPASGVRPAIVASKGATSGATSSVVTDPIDTTGVTLLVVAVTEWQVAPSTPTDSAGNAWTALPVISPAANLHDTAQLFYCLNPTTSAAHTFSLSTAPTTNTFPTLAVAGFKGGSGAGAADGSSGATIEAGAAGTTIQPGSITPTGSGELVVSSLHWGVAASVSVDSGVQPMVAVPYVNGQAEGTAIGFIVQGAAAAINPRWTLSASSTHVSSGIAAFQVPGAGGASYTRSGADSLGISDVGTVAAARPRSGVDAVGVSDVGTRAVGAPRSGVESLAVADAGVAVVGRARGGADAVAVSEANAVHGARARTGVDAVGVSDAGARAAQAAARGGADALAIADAGAKRGAASRTGVDSVAFGEANVVQRGRTSTGSDVVSIGDAGGRLGVWARGGVDTVAVADVGARGPSSQARGGFEAVALTDQGLVARSLVRGGTESWTISDAAITIVPTIIRGIVTGEAAGGMLTGGNAAQRVATGTAAGGSSGRAATPLYTGP